MLCHLPTKRYFIFSASILTTNHKSLRRSYWTVKATKMVQGQWTGDLGPFFEEAGRKELNRVGKTEELTLGHRRTDRKLNTQTDYWWE